MNDTEKNHTMKITGIDTDEMIGIEREAENTTSTEGTSMRNQSSLRLNNKEKEVLEEKDRESTRKPEHEERWHTHN